MSTSTRQLILQRCFEAIQAKGFETLRTDKEIARLKITKGAFYHYFPNKAELGYAVVDEVMLPYYEQKWASLANIESGVAEALMSVLEQEKNKATETSIKRGDVLTNMILEMSHSDDLFRQKLEAVNEVHALMSEIRDAWRQVPGLLPATRSVGVGQSMPSLAVH